MGFQEILKELSDATGASCALMGIDGIPVRTCPAPHGSLDIETVGVEYGKVLQEATKAASILELGKVEDLLITADNAQVVLRPITPEYFAAIVLASSANVGKARFLLRTAAKKLAQEL